MAEEFQNLLRRVRDEKDPDAWDLFVEQFSRTVHSVLNRFSFLTASEKQDLFQEVFLILFERGVQNFKGESERGFRAFVARITQNAAISLLRKHSRRFEIPFPSLYEDDEGDDPVLFEPPSEDTRTDPLAAALTKEHADHLRDCMKELPVVNQQVFWLREGEDRPYKEIAEILDIPQGTVASRYDRAKKRIMDCLQELGLL